MLLTKIKSLRIVVFGEPVSNFEHHGEGSMSSKRLQLITPPFIIDLLHFSTFNHFFFVESAGGMGFVRRYMLLAFSALQVVMFLFLGVVRL